MANLRLSLYEAKLSTQKVQDKSFFHRGKSLTDDKDAPNWNSSLDYVQKKVRCYIFQCKELPAADSDGQSDPYVEVYNMIGKNE